MARFVRNFEGAFIVTGHPYSRADLLYEFAMYLNSFTSKSAVSSQICKHVYEHLPIAKEILARHGRLRGLVKAFPYLQLDGGIH